jgi:hypothetical protein
MQQKFLVAVLVVFIFILFLQCFRFMQGEPLLIQEAFVSTNGITRPDDCLCLPGYVPSRTKAKGVGGQVLQIRNKPELYFLPSGLRTAHWIPSCTMQGIEMNFCSGFRVVSDMEWNSLVDNKGPTLSLSLWNDMQGSTLTPTYFCQRLTDPADVKQCTRIT